MSNYGPPNGQYPGQPSDPWQQHDPYGQPGGAQYPASPYGSPEPWSTPVTPGSVTPPGQPYGQPYGQPAGQPPGYDPGHQPDPYQQQGGYAGQPGYPPQPDPYGAAAPPPAWGPPTPPPRKRGPGLLVGVVAVLVVLLCGGGLVALYVIGKNNANPTTQHSQAPLAQATGQATSMPTGAANSPTADMLDPVTAIKVGQCVVNNGSNNQADLQIVPCAKNTFKVLARFNNTLDPKKCGSVAGYTHYFTYETTPKTDDFLLCLKQQ